MKGIPIVGWGAVSPVGDPAGEPIATILARGIEVFGQEELAESRVIATARVPDPWPEALLEGFGNMRPIDRVGRLACGATRLALEDARFSTGESGAGLVLGTLFGGLRTIAEFDRRAMAEGPMYASPLDFANSVINAAAGQTAIWHKLDGPNATIGGGPTAALQALAWAADLIAAGEPGPLLAGGSEELAADAILAFGAAARLCGAAGPRPFDAHRDGLALGEGAAFLVLEGEDHARERGAPRRAKLCGVAGSFDPSRGADAASAATSMARAVRLALEQAGIDRSQVALVSSGASGDLDDANEAQGLVAAGIKAPVIAIKSALGEAFGASGALAAIVALEVLGGALAPPVRGFERAERAWQDLDIVREPRSLDPGGYALVTARARDGASWAAVVAREDDEGG